MSTSGSQSRASRFLDAGRVCDALHRRVWILARPWQAAGAKTRACGSHPFNSANMSCATLASVPDGSSTCIWIAAAAWSMRSASLSFVSVTTCRYMYT